MLPCNMKRIIFSIIYFFTKLTVNVNLGGLFVCGCERVCVCVYVKGVGV